MKKKYKTKREKLRAQAKQKAKTRRERQRVIKMPRRKGIEGERTINATLRNTARALRWLRPRLKNRDLASKGTLRRLHNAAATCDALAVVHEHKVQKFGRLAS